MSANIELIDKAHEDLCVCDLAVEGACKILGEYSNDDFASGLCIAFLRLQADVRELIAAQG